MRNILAVGAHYDDVELGCSGTLMKHVDAGDNVVIVTITDSSYSNPDGELIRSKEVAYREGLEASKLIGAELVCLNYRTFEVPFTEKLTRDIAYEIEHRNIDTIYCHWTHDIHRDHQYAARCTMMAGRHVPRFLMYRSNYYDSDETFQGNIYSDISDYMERKKEVIKVHQSELERVRYTWIEFFTNQNRNNGQLIGVQYAECFQIVRYLL